MPALPAGKTEANMQKTLKTLIAAIAVASVPLVPTGAAHAAGEVRSNQFWWPNQLDLSSLRQHAAEANPLGADFNYTRAFKALNLNAVTVEHDAPGAAASAAHSAAACAGADAAGGGPAGVASARSVVTTSDSRARCACHRPQPLNAAACAASVACEGCTRG
jgi:hypothetical protein